MHEVWTHFVTTWTNGFKSALLTYKAWVLLCAYDFRNNSFLKISENTVCYLVAMKSAMNVFVILYPYKVMNVVMSTHGIQSGLWRILSWFNSDLTAFSIPFQWFMMHGHDICYLWVHNNVDLMLLHGCAVEGDA